MLSQSPSPGPPDDGASSSGLSVGVSSPDPDTLVLAPVGEADRFTIPVLRQALDDAAAQGPARVIVDLDQLTFLDASSLGVLVDARRQLSAAGGTLHVRCRTDQHLRLLSLTGLDGMLEPTP
jgi:anti-sigma B factor antagonist